MATASASASAASVPPGHALFSGNPYRVILRLAMPTVIAMLSQSAVNEMDVVFFSRLPCPESSTAQAALLPSLIIVWLFGGALSAISVGTLSLTARRYAEKNYLDAGAVLANAAWFCLVGGAVLSVVGLVTLRPIFTLLIDKDAVRNTAYSYTWWRLLGVISMAMTMAVKGFFDGIGRTQVHLVAAIVMNVFNVLFCWLLIFGHWGLPRMGAEGAGVSAFICTWIGLFIMLAYAAAERMRFHPVRFSNLSRKLTWDILKLSVPAAAATVVMMVGFSLFVKVASVLDRTDPTAGTILDASKCGAAEAVYGAATTDIVAILKLTFTACLGFGTAAATLVGQALGAKRPDDGERYGWATVRIGAVIFAVVGICEGLIFTHPIVNFITQSEAVRQAALVPMRMVGMITPVIAIGMILSEALFGAGSTVFVAVTQFVLIFLLLVPLAWVLALAMHLGLPGMWIAALVYFAFAATIMALYFRRGSWKKIVL
jgi:MATE family multidrug resistance protein